MKKQRSIIFYFFILLVIVLINYAGSVFHFRKDLTEEKRYSLTSTTRDILRNIKQPVSIIVFLKGDFPTEFRSLANRTQEFLSLLKETAPAKISYQFIDPQDKIDDAKTWGDSLHSLGASPINLSVQVKAGQ